MTRRGLAVFAGLIGVLSVLALSLSVLDGWRPAGGNGVPFVEALIQDTPQAQVDAYLGRVSSGDRTGALGVWQLPDRTFPEVLDRLIQRRMVVTERLTTQPPKVHRIAAIEWWSMCCEPHPVTDRRHATLARVTVEIGRAPVERYVFDVGVADPARSLIDGLARRWILRDVYRSDEQPLLVRWVSNGHGSEYLGPLR